MNDREASPRAVSRIRRFFAKFIKTSSPDQVTEDALTELESEGMIDHDESEMMQSILFLDKTTVHDVMVPRTEVAYVDRQADFEEIIKCVIDSGHTRIPVVDRTLDNVLGFVHAKDLLAFWNKAGEFQLDRVLRKPFNVPENKKLDEMLAEFQKRREHIALVIDEFGGTSGLVTIEDVLEEIVGEIEDEYDREKPPAAIRDGNTMTVPGRFEMAKLCALFEVEEFDGTFATVGGWIFERIGRIPHSGEQFQLDGFDVLVEAATERHIRRLHITKIETPVEVDE